MSIYCVYLTVYKGSKLPVNACQQFPDLVNFFWSRKLG